MTAAEMFHPARMLSGLVVCVGAHAVLDQLGVSPSERIGLVAPLAMGTLYVFDAFVRWRRRPKWSADSYNNLAQDAEATRCLLTQPAEVAYLERRLPSNEEILARSTQFIIAADRSRS